MNNRDSGKNSRRRATNDCEVVFLDSGIGGIPYFQHFCRRNSGLNAVYCADSKNFPYGPRSKTELLEIVTNLAQKLIRIFNPDIMVIACNAASVSTLKELREMFPDRAFVGTVPAVRPAIQESRAHHIGVIGTQRTVSDDYIDRLIQETGIDCKVSRLAAPDLVEFVERHLYRASEEEKNDIVKKYVRIFRESGADGIVLGCTHFLFLADEFKKIAAPDIRIFDSINGVCNRAELLLRKRGEVGSKLCVSRSLPDSPTALAQRSSAFPLECTKRLIVTGNDAGDEIWLQRAKQFDMELHGIAELMPVDTQQ